MPRRYKLRLGDGTVLVVDEGGLNTWQVDARAMVQAATGGWRPLKDVLAVQHAAAKYASQQSSSPRAALPLIPPPSKPRDDRSPRVPTAPSWGGVAAPPSSVGPAGVLALAEEPAGPPDEGTPRESTADEVIIPSTPPDEDAASPLRETLTQSEPLGLSMSEVPERQPWVDEPALASTDSLLHPPPPAEEAVAILPNPPDDEEPIRPDPPRWRDSMEPPPVTERPHLQVLAEGLTPAPTIALKPLADRDEPRTPAATRPGVHEDEQDRFLEVTQQVYVLDERLIRPVEAFGRLLSKGLDHLDRWCRRLRSSRLLRRLGTSASGWTAGSKGWVDRLARPDRLRPSDPASAPAVSSAAYPASSEPLKPPPPISELPVLRLADIDEPTEAEDIYEGDDESVVHAAWLWTRRIVFITGLVAGGVLAALTREAWFPKAAHLAGVAFTGTINTVRSREQREWERRALQEATEQLPHLAPETIQLLLSDSPTGVLDPPEAFERASDAADRGLAALTPGEAQDLGGLRATLLDTLSPSEAEHLRDYDRVRTRRATFAFEDRSALDLFARGARALPSESRARLQELLGKAIAAGLPRPTQVPPAGSAER